MTPQEEALNNQIKVLPIIMETQGSIKILTEGQHEIQVHLNEVDQRLEDGSKVMKGLIGDVKQLFNLFNNHVQRTEQMHKDQMRSNEDIKVEIKDNKLKDLGAELTEKNKEITALKAKMWGFAKMIFNSILAFLTGGAIVYFFK